MNKVSFQGKRKLHLLHGPAKAASRKKLVEIKQKFDPLQVVVFEEGSTTKDIEDNLMSTSLFTDERLVVLENPQDTDFLLTTNYQLPTSLILWFDHEISPTKPIFKWVKENDGQTLYFPENKEVSVFPFLDYLAYGDKKAFLESKNLKQAGFDIYYMITMVFYLLRSLTYTPKNAPPFVRQKLERQRKNFNIRGIENFYKYMLDLDFKLKSGLIESQQAEFTLINKFMD